jgi:hypothetical protein
VAMTPDIVGDMDDEFAAPSDLYWDDVVDVVCAGTGPGALAQAVVCADLGFTVELADALGPTDLSDPDTTAYLEAMTEDLGPLNRVPWELELPVVHAAPVAPRTDRRTKIEPFIGSLLRDWSARCVASPFGVVYSAVPEAGITPMRSDSGESIRVAVLGPYRPDADRPGAALADWLAEQVWERDLARHGLGLQRLIFEYGRVAGAAIDTRSGTRLVRATAGVALSTGAVPDGATWPVQPELRDVVAQVAIVSRTGSRFSRVELLFET